MKTKTHLYLLCFALFFVQFSLLAASIPKTGILQYKWGAYPLEFYRNTILDTITTPHSFKLETFGDKRGIIGTLLPIYHINKTNPTLTLKLNYKTKDCTNLSLIVSSIGECEQVNSVDTIQLPTTETWNVSTKTLNTKNTYLLNVSIAANGSKQKDANIWISDLDVFVDGKKVVDNPRENKATSNLKKEDVIVWNKTNFDNFPFIRNRLLGLGETTHGTKTIIDMGVEIMKERILKHQCRLVSFEIPLEFSELNHF